VDPRGGFGLLLDIPSRDFAFCLFRLSVGVAKSDEE